MGLASIGVTRLPFRLPMRPISRTRLCAAANRPSGAASSWRRSPAVSKGREDRGLNVAVRVELRGVLAKPVAVPFFSPVSGWPDGISSRPWPNAERSMLGAGEEISHANDHGFGAGRSGAVGDSSKCSDATGRAARLVRRPKRVLGPSTHEALVLLYVGPQEQRPAAGVRANCARTGYGRLFSTLLHYRSDSPESPPSNPEISLDGAPTAGKSAPAGFPQIPQA